MKKKNSSNRILGLLLSTSSLVLLPLTDVQAACRPTSGSVISGDTVTCFGTTNGQDGTAGYGTGAESGLTINVQNAATVTGADFGMFLSGPNIINNSGTITSSGFYGINTDGDTTITNSGTIIGGGFGIDVGGYTTVTNTGTITGSTAYGIYSIYPATITNSGAITGGGNDGISVGDNSTLINSGTITGFHSGVSGSINSFNFTVTNSGTITGDTYGIVLFADNHITNTGTVTGGADGIHVSDNNTIANSGTITGSGADGISLGSNNTVTNTGTITGVYGIYVGGTSNTIVNSGTINGSGYGVLGVGSTNLINFGTITNTAGTAGAAIVLSSSSSNNTLTFEPGSRVIGGIELGTSDTLYFAGGNYRYTFSGANAPDSATVTGGEPFVVTSTQIATLDPTALGMEDRVLLDVTGDVSQVISGRFDTMQRPSTSDKPTNIWASALGSEREQHADGASSGATHDFSGAAAGVDSKLSPEGTIGGFVGGGSGRLDVSDTQTVNSDYVFGGGYGHYDLGASFVNVALLGGSSHNSSQRTVADNTVASGQENFTADYDGSFISPEVTVGYRIPVSSSTTFTPSAKLRYIAGWLDSFNDNNLTVNSHTLQDVETSMRIAATEVTPMKDGEVDTKVEIGTLMQQRVGSDTINATLIGNAVSFDKPGNQTSVGGYVGLGMDYRFTSDVKLFAHVNAVALTDSTSASGQMGVGMAF